MSGGGHCSILSGLFRERIDGDEDDKSIEREGLNLNKYENNLHLLFCVLCECFGLLVFPFSSWLRLYLGFSIQVPPIK
jgi:hypothetical protein